MVRHWDGTPHNLSDLLKNMDRKGSLDYVIAYIKFLYLQNIGWISYERSKTCLPNLFVRISREYKFLFEVLLKILLWLSALGYCIIIVLVEDVGRDSSVGMATRYGLEGPGIESQWGGKIFRTRPDRPWGPPSLLYNGYRVFPEGKAVGAWRWPSTPSSAEVKERVEIYLYSPSGLSWPVSGWILTLPLTLPS